MELTEETRRTLVKTGTYYLNNGCRVTLGGHINPDYCSVTSAYPGFWGVRWETLVGMGDNRRFGPFDLFRVSSAWLGCLPAPRSDWQTEEDYERARARGDAR